MELRIPLLANKHVCTLIVQKNDKVPKPLVYDTIFDKIVKK
jgi:hypothetical protein